MRVESHEPSKGPHDVGLSPGIRVCSVDGCHLPVKRRGWCNTHSARWYKTGSVGATSTGRTVVDHFTRYEVDPKGCWVWSGPLFQVGYGQTSRPYKGTNLAYKAFYLHFVGPVPPGMQLDHLCRNRACVNPAHLEPVTARENLLRGSAGYGARTLCKAGLHDITDPANWYIAPGSPHARTCHPCSRLKWARQDAKRRG